MVPLFQIARQSIALDLRDLLQRAAAPHAASLQTLQRTLKRQARFVPPGFVPFALAGSLFIVIAGMHELVQDHGRAAHRPHTHLRMTKLAYANGQITVP